MNDYAKHQIEKVLQFEGGYVNDPNDSGGETMMGITKRNFPKEFAEIMMLDSANQYEYAINFYYEKFWQTIPQGMPQQVKALFFDMSINMGARQATEILQIAIRLIGDNNIMIDGILGNKTISSLSMMNITHKIELVNAIKISRACQYGEIIGRNPKNEKFKIGWLKRTLYSVDNQTNA